MNDYEAYAEGFRCGKADYFLFRRMSVIASTWPNQAYVKGYIAGFWYKKTVKPNDDSDENYEEVIYG
jgi:hypothetical protein